MTEQAMKNNIRHPERSVTQSKDLPSIVYLNIEILTGRTHQIRYHLSQHGLPVIGDYLYMDKADYNESDPLSLTAYRLVVLDNEGEMIDVSVKE